MNWKSWLRARSLGNDSVPQQSSSNPKRLQVNPDEELHGVTQQLIDRVKSFTLDDFKKFPLRDDGTTEASFGDEMAAAASASVRRDLSEWQERHATLILAKVKELAQLRFKLSPGHLKERDFWRIYFTLVKADIAEYELRAIQLAKLRKMAVEDGKSSDSSTIEVEMAETVQRTSLQPSTP
ncbi:unnamed protein product [Linum trigynum]|uniref:BSD domain-containing protein n=1 Tax=Linum trigynum TaxID=586398 RepID=A0AAV2GRR7_9ROSI